eukprot:CAMPEP_0185285550 /NCGR_PEP_ID=MMETSP1363-20130426/1799_1 /TAXON_ID=38817 /ORGANISM="Gephyrocapsa oceanica, Strain RCC1303" /LENGTH=51 /DNA_ID=CAMNT_0027881337 /DNA_START=84 /DNA_END=239 /DNA_ORIENTATION=-
MNMTMTCTQDVDSRKLVADAGGGLWQPQAPDRGRARERAGGGRVAPRLLEA